MAYVKFKQVLELSLAGNLGNYFNKINILIQFLVNLRYHGPLTIVTTLLQQFKFSEVTEVDMLNVIKNLKWTAFDSDGVSVLF